MNKRDAANFFALQQFVDELCQCSSRDEMFAMAHERYIAVKTSPRGKGKAIIQAFCYPLLSYLSSPTGDPEVQAMHARFESEILTVRNRLRQLGAFPR